MSVSGGLNRYGLRLPVRWLLLLPHRYVTVSSPVVKAFVNA